MVCILWPPLSRVHTEIDDLPPFASWETLSDNLWEAEKLRVTPEAFYNQTDSLNFPL